MGQLILITCCKTKLAGGTPNYTQSDILAKFLGPATLLRLMAFRRELALELELDTGPDVGLWNSDANIRYLPAFKRYQGRMFAKADFERNYPTRKQNVDVLIISALYGLIDANDLIREYELTMKCSIGTRRTIHTWWKNMILGEIVCEYIRSLRPSVVHDLLTLDYRKAIAPWPPDISMIQFRQYNYPKQGSGSNYRRGEDLHMLLHE